MTVVYVSFVADVVCRRLCDGCEAGRRRSASLLGASQLEAGSLRTASLEHNHVRMAL